MAQVFYEDFEDAPAGGYDNDNANGWAETIDAGQGHSIDSANQDVARPPTGNDYVLKIVSGAAAAGNSDVFTISSGLGLTGDAYVRIYFQLASEGLGNGEHVMLAKAGSSSNWWLHLYDNNGTPELYVEFNDPVGGDFDTAHHAIAVDTWYCVEIYSNSSTKAWGFRVNGEEVDSGTGGYLYGTNYLILGTQDASNPNDRAWTGYFDIVETDNADWVGCEAAGGETHALAGAIAGASSLSGVLVAIRALAGPIAATSAVTGGLKALRYLAGALASTTSMTGILKASRSLAGAIASTTSVTGILKAARSLAGTVASASSVTGTLKAIRSLAGSVAAATSLTGRLLCKRALSGTIAATSAISGSLSLTGKILLAGTIAATSAISGRLKAIRSMAGAIAAASSLSARLLCKRALSGTIAATSAISGSLSLTGQILLAGAIAATSAVSGSLKAIRSMAGSLASTASISGSLKAVRSLAGAIAAISSVTGRLAQEIIVAALRRIFYKDTLRREFTLDTKRRAFEQDTERRIFNIK